MLPETWFMPLLLAHAASCFFMTGVIWFVQVVAYPQMGLVPETDFVPHHCGHVRRTTWVVGPPILFELASGFPLLGGPVEFLPVLGVLYALLLAIVGITLLVMSPLHLLLERGRDDRWLRLLRTANGIRTLFWSVRAAGLAWVVMEQTW